MYSLNNEVGFCTTSEKILARALEKARVQFKHNIFIHGWEVDLLVDGRVVVEVDGFIHCQKSIMEKDHRKDKELREAGFTVIRLHNDNCRYDIKRSLKKIIEALKEHKKVQKINPPTQYLQPWQLKLLHSYSSLLGRTN